MTSTDSIILQDYGVTRIAWHGAWHSTMWSEYAVPQVHSCPRHDWMRLRERLRALLEAASPRFKTRLSTDWNKTRNLAGIIRSANSQPASRTVLSRKTTFLQRSAFVQVLLLHHGFRTWLPLVCVVILPALRLSWPTVTVVSEGRVLISSRDWSWVHVEKRAPRFVP